MKYLIYLAFLLSNLSCSPLIKYSQSNRQFEQEVSLLESLDLEEKAGEKDLLFIGSSSIRLWDNVQVDMYPYSSVKRGYGGAHFYDLIHFSERLVKNHSPKAILIFVANDITGSNDITNLVGDLSLKRLKSCLGIIIKRLEAFINIYPFF